MEGVDSEMSVYAFVVVGLNGSGRAGRKLTCESIILPFKIN
jgi:hypothetical protein